MPPRITSTTVRWHFGIDTADAPLKGSLYRRDRWCLMSDAVVAFRYTSRHKGWAHGRVIGIDLAERLLDIARTKSIAPNYTTSTSDGPTWKL